MIRIAENKGYCFIGKFTELIVRLSSIENKNLTLLEYIRLEQNRSKKLLN